MRLAVRLGCVVLLLLGLGLAGCNDLEEVSSAADPAQIQPVAGTDTNEVILTEQALKDLGIQTQPVRGVVSGATATVTAVIPMAAVVYDPRGESWTYTTPAARTFIRARVVLDRVVDGTAYLRSGPRVGTSVVTVGAPELLGAEYGVGGE